MTFLALRSIEVVQKKNRGVDAEYNLMASAHLASNDQGNGV